MDYDTNYHHAFAAIRDNMTRMRGVAIEYIPVDAERTREFNKNGQSTLFSIIEERCKDFYNRFETIRLAVVMQLGNYDNQVADKGLEHSQAWYDIVKEFQDYRSLTILIGKL